MKEDDAEDGGSVGFELVSGERRFHAALEAGLREVPCIELTVDDDVALEIALIENLQRRDLSPFEEAEGFRTLIQKYGYTHDQVAQAVGKSRVTITEALKILELPTEIRDLCRHADITAKGMLLEIAKASTVEAMRQLIQEIVEDRLDRGALRLRRQELADGGEDAAGEAAAGDAEAVADQAERQPTPRTTARPFVFKLRDSDRRLTVSLSFRTEKEPAPQEVIAALESMIEQLRAEITGGGTNGKRQTRASLRPARARGSSSRAATSDTAQGTDSQAGSGPGSNPGSGGKEEGTAGAGVQR
jgi:ParB family chromosome partitioning protein